MSAALRTSCGVACRRERGCLDARGELERPEELRPKVGRLGARGEQLLLQPPERALVAVADELYLELAEPLLDALTLHDRHGVLDDLRAGGPQGLAPRAQARDARRLDAAKMHDEEREQLTRRLCGRAGGLDLETGGTGRDLELPEPAALLGAVAQREPVPSEREVGRVEVRRDEVATRQLDAFEIAQAKAVGGGELELVFTRRTHYPAA